MTTKQLKHALLFLAQFGVVAGGICFILAGFVRAVQIKPAPVAPATPIPVVIVIQPKTVEDGDKMVARFSRGLLWSADAFSKKVVKK